MTTQITWSISQLDCKPQELNEQNYVIVAHWQCVGNDGNYASSVYNTCSFSVEEKADFVPYQDLTEQMVLGWIWASGVDKAATEAAVEQMIENQINPPVVSPPLPWSN
jgi:hypothetical protein